MEKKKKFIIYFIYAAIWFLIVFSIVKYGLSVVAPFVLAFIISYILKTPITMIMAKTKLKRKPVAILCVILLYSTVGFAISLFGIKIITWLKELFFNFPMLYATSIEPELMVLFKAIEELALKMDSSLMTALEEFSYEFLQTLGKMVTNLSMSVVGVVSNYATTLPGFFIKILIMIICTFFISVDYDEISDFLLRQFSQRGKEVLLHIKDYIINTLWVCIRSYALIMSITFIELSIGLLILGIENAVWIALIISIFDVLPVLGTGGIMIPWTIVTAIKGQYGLALGLLLVYLFITIIRNILEPKIVGSQIGLHPVATLICMFVGLNFFGILGLFCFPILLSLLKHLNDTKVISIFK